MSRRVRIYLANIAVFLDAFMIRHAHRIPGVVSGGVFYRDHLPFFSVVMWAAPVSANELNTPIFPQLISARATKSDSSGVLTVSRLLTSTPPPPIVPSAPVVLVSALVSRPRC